MKDQIISFNTAKLAKEKGFDEKVFWYWENNNSNVIQASKDITYIGGFKANSHKGFRGDKKYKKIPYISRPTQSLLQKWLREKHKIFVSVIEDYDLEKDSWFFGYTINYIVKDIKDLGTEDINFDYETYEKALESGLQQALKLIKE